MILIDRAEAAELPKKFLVVPECASPWWLNRIPLQAGQLVLIALRALNGNPRPRWAWSHVSAVAGERVVVVVDTDARDCPVQRGDRVEIDGSRHALMTLTEAAAQTFEDWKQEARLACLAGCDVGRRVN